eukprot:scaffold10560_cov272-Chaetoceros_neogracile.AAC.7
MESQAGDIASQSVYQRSIQDAIGSKDYYPNFKFANIPFRAYPYAPGFECKIDGTTRTQCEIAEPVQTSKF